MDKWIPTTERLPKERDSIFEKYYGTEKWNDAMFRKTSGKVLVTVRYPSGSKEVTAISTQDGKWSDPFIRTLNVEVLAWMPMPEPYNDGEQE